MTDCNCTVANATADAQYLKGTFAKQQYNTMLNLFEHFLADFVNDDYETEGDLELVALPYGSVSGVYLLIESNNIELSYDADEGHEHVNAIDTSRTMVLDTEGVDSTRNVWVLYSASQEPETIYLIDRDGYFSQR